jgi:S1-C subfamily serine protease
MTTPRFLTHSPKTAIAVAGFVLVALDCKSARFGASDAGAPPSLGGSVAQAAPPVPAPAPADPVRPLGRTPDEQNTIDVFRAVAPSTVFVTQKRVVIDYFGGARELEAGSGSGFVWDDRGHVVTNFHVIQKARSLTVTLHDQETFDARVVGVEPRKDIAVLKIEAVASKLHPIGRPDKNYRIEVGQKTLAIGNPFGLDHTLTTGVVSAVGREMRGIGGVSIRDMVQTDAAINPGNSGGPLLDSAGQLIGMNTMIYSKSGASDGIGFAVPVTTVARVVPQIIAKGKADQVGIGVQIDPAQRLEERARIKGVIVLSVVPGSPAAKAGIVGIEQTPRGIKLGDVIVAIDKHDIGDYNDLYNTLDRYQAGTEVELSLLRAGELRKVKVPLIALD